MTAALLSACHSNEEPSPAPARSPPPPPDSGGLLEDSFDQLYPLFLLHKLDERARAHQWSRYQDRWVRWTGTFVACTRNGALFRHLQQTSTFDVSLEVDPAVRKRLMAVKPGTPVAYVGQLHAYDPVLGTFFLVRGDVVVGAGGGGP